MFCLNKYSLIYSRIRLLSMNHVYSQQSPVSFSHKKAINKVLIANRGEIACRVIKTAKRLGIKTVAVYSVADVNAMHKKMADESYCIGGAQPQESYLSINKILQVAKYSRSQAVHPGYGFLSENVEFCTACQNHDIIFIGPPATAIRDMGIKSISKEIMEKAGVSIIPGYHGSDQSIERLREEAERIGFPVMIKAVRGGGGKGMRIAKSLSEFNSQLDSAKNEALKSFNDNIVLLEKFIGDPRHVEVQVFGDAHGNYVYLYERDCSVQRRHQKIIEEAPAPGVTKELRQQLGQAAVRAAAAVNYVGAGTVEFILDRRTNEYYFMEMNTRLQVEHPVTEMITNTDLVEWQFKVACGDPLPLSQAEIPLSGHAFEARIYAEDPRNDFLPGAGYLHYLSTPEPDKNVRIETGVCQQDNISVYYDPMIAKLVVSGSDRESALRKFDDCLTQYNVAGLETNINFLLQLTRHPEFQAGNVHTNFINEHHADLLPKPKSLSATTISQLVLAQIFSERLDLIKNISIINDPFLTEFDFRVNHNSVRTLEFMNDGKKLTFLVESHSNNHFTINCTDDVAQVVEVEADWEQQDKCLLITTKVNNKTVKCRAVVFENKISIFSSDGCQTFEQVLPEYMIQSGVSNVRSSASAPMPGLIDKIFVKADDFVSAGQPLLILIAMKMEYVIKAPSDGVIDSVFFQPGDTVKKNEILFKLKE